MLVTRLSDTKLREIHGSVQSYQYWTFSEVKSVFQFVMLIEAPQNFSSQNVSSFLNTCSDIFKVKEFAYPLHISLYKTRSISLIGMLIVYKIISYTSRHLKLKNPLISIPSAVMGSFVDCGIFGIMLAHIRKEDPAHSYSDLKIIESDRFFLYPQRLFRDEISSAENTKGLFIDTISDFYNKHGNHKAGLPISHCVGELVMNFWSHATIDSETVVTARGNANAFTLVLVDNGDGIISSLGDVLRDVPGQVRLKKCIERKVSSRRTTDFHMGLGLYYVSKLAIANNGMLNIWSEGHHLAVTKRGTNVSPCGFWKGTIVELVLDVNAPKSLADLDIYADFKPTGLINFGGEDEAHHSH